MPETVAELDRVAEGLVGRRLGELLDIPTGERQSVRTKGRVGHHVERILGVATNSDAGPDLPHLGIEVKSVPMRRLKRSSQLTAKERTFITLINYVDITGQPFDGSPLDLKTRLTLYVFYEWERDRPTAEVPILRTFVHRRDDAATDMAVHAHRHVQDVVIAGQAHLLSEGDTPGIGAATKDQGGKWVAQPFSREPARRRGFAWKAAYTTALYRDIETGPTPVRGGLTGLMIEAEERVRERHGATVGQLRDEFLPGRSDRAKGLTGAVARRLLGSPTAAREPAEYRRFGLMVRAVRTGPQGRPWEGTSFPAIDFRDVVDEEWESSPLVEQLSSILLVIFHDPRKVVVEAELERVVLWEPTPGDIDVMRREYEVFRRCISESRPEDMPRESQTRVLHMRPHGRDGTDLVSLPDGRPFRRLSFWLNKDYLRDVLGT